MDALRLPVGLTVCALAIMLVRGQRPEFAALGSIAAGIAAYFALREELMAVVDYLEKAAFSIRAPDGMMRTVLKAGGIALISEFASDLCCDAGERALAGWIDLAERVMLTSMCIPFAGEMMEQLQGLLT